MLCTNCFDDECITGKTDVPVTVNGEETILHNVECERCPSCGDITFTHAQSLEIDKKRVALEFGIKPLLTRSQLKDLRALLGMNLDEICAILHIGKNTYGRWERGDVEITPSMNILVHNFIEKIPGARVNLFDSDRITALKKANSFLLRKDLSLGQYIREAVEATKLFPSIVCSALEVQQAEFTKIQNNEVNPEKVPYEINAKIGHYFLLNMDDLKNLFNSAISIIEMKSSVTAVHARSTSYDGKAAAIQASSVNKILEKLAEKKGISTAMKQVSDDYLAKVDAEMRRLGSKEVVR